MHFKSFFSIVAASLLLAVYPATLSAQAGSGLQKTPQGIPWFVSDRQSRYPGAEASMRIASSKWRGQWASKVQSGKISGKFRLVSVNGGTYLVVAKIREPLFANAEKLRKDLLDTAARKAGCTHDANVLLKYGSHHNLDKMAVRVQCGFLENS